MNRTLLDEEKHIKLIDTLCKYVGTREITARMGVDILSDNGYKYTPHVATLGHALSNDDRFIMTRATGEGVLYRRRRSN